MKNTSTAVVVLSGGQDSMTCLGVALEQYRDVSAIGFSYGQKHKVELQQAAHLCAKHGVPFRVVGLDFLPSLVTSALTGDGEVGQPHPYKTGLPSSFVPNRNALFLTLAHAYAQEIKAQTLITGVCQTDFSGYPDCRRVFIDHLETALNVGYETGITISTPLMDIGKAETFALAERVGILEDVLELSHTCYNGDRNHRHVWGYGCGTCPACELRSAGFTKFREGDFNPDLVDRALNS